MPKKTTPPAAIASPPRKKLKSPREEKSQNFAGNKIFIFAGAHPSVELMFIEKRNGEDAYTHPLLELTFGRIQFKKLETAGFKHAFQKRVSLTIHQAKVDHIKDGNTYYKRLFVRYLPEDKVSTKESRKELMQMVSDLFKVPDNNKFAQNYFFDGLSDLTFSTYKGNTPPFDHFLLDTDIPKVMSELFGELDINFAPKYPDCAKFFFSANPPPSIAIQNYGYLKLENNKQDTLENIENYSQDE